MEFDIIATVLDHLDSSSFNDFIYYILKHDDNFSNCHYFLGTEKDIFENPPERFCQTAEAFFINYFPYSLYRDFNLSKLDIGGFKRQVIDYINRRSYKIWLPVDGTRIYSISNYDSRKMGISDEELMRFYEKELTDILPSGFDFGIGNINTVLNTACENKEYEELIKDFFQTNDSGICIHLSDDKIYATRFSSEKEFDGIITTPDVILQPIIKKVLDTDDLLNEFNCLINRDTKESVLEDFLYSNYDTMFGSKYDLVSTQVWLNFPEFDIGKKERRLDMLMRNSVSQDWDVFELKRSSVILTKTKSDVPMLVAAVYDALAQLRNYKQILSKDKVKAYFASKGISYYKPEFNLVIGKRPRISKEKWEWILSQQHDLKIITYDDILDDAKVRLNDLKTKIRV